MITPLLELARDRLSGEPPARGAARFEALAARAAVGERERDVRLRVLYGVALAAALVLVGFGFWPRSELTYRVEAGNVDASGRVLGGPEGGDIRFSDGSFVKLEPFARTKVEGVSARGGRVRLEHGALHVSITKRPHAQWAIAAGPYVVHVKGTSFEVRWSPADQSLDVVMQSGSVVVNGPLVAEGLALDKGQRLSLALEKRSVIVERGPKTNLLPAPPASASTVTSEPPTAKIASARSEGARRTWMELVAQGSFGAVIEAAEARGLEKTLAQASAEDLSALADAARYGRRVDIATAALLAQRRRYPGTAQAEQAAFFLGRLSEGRSEAVTWYDRYLKESPDGSYAPQAVGRKLMLVHELEGAARARPLAEEYLRRYPKGPYAAAAKKILR
jgi:hypothetical protein